MNYEEKTEALVDLLENNEVTEAQVTYLLEWLQGNGYVENTAAEAMEQEELQYDKDVKNGLYGN
tara:strand:- start:315 stop:506 length:192 start_codon:yes stop_codon:yes gene_type:complete